MSAQSSARSKRRQSALFSSQGRPSLLPLPQIAISNITTSTPARGLQRHVPAPLPTPQPASAHLLSTPARGYDDNTTFFGFSPGAEAEETALLAVDYRSAGHERHHAQEEQMHDELFDDTTILEQRAFANRRTSHEGDQSSGGLGALIFNNLIAGVQAQDALERLELGKRRDSDTSRRSEHVSPIKRNASFTVSTGGEYLVDYETDVRFGDELLEKDFDTATLSRDSPLDLAQIITSSTSYHASSPAHQTHTPTSLAELSSGGTRRIAPRPLDPPTAHLDECERIQESPTCISAASAQALTSYGARSGSIQDDEDEAGSALEAAGHPVQDQIEQHEDLSEQVATSAVDSPARSEPAPSVSARPSPALEERRQARRLRRGLTASMATLLSPVAEDRDREKSISRSCSMLAEAIEAQQLSLIAHVDVPITISEPPMPENLCQEPEEELPLKWHSDFHDAVEPAGVPLSQPEPIIADQSTSNVSKPLPLASVLAASLSQPQSMNIFATSAASEPQTFQTTEAVTAPAQPITRPLANASTKPSHTVRRQTTSAVVSKQPARSSDKGEGPSYLRPTLSRSIQQRDPLPAKRVLSTSQRKAVNSQSMTQKHTSLHAPRQSIASPQSQASIHAPSQPRAPSATVVASLHRSAAVEAKEDTRDEHHKAARDNHRKLVAESHHDDSGQVEAHKYSLKRDQPSQRSASVPATVQEALNDRADDPGLTLPRGFAFNRTRKRLRQEDPALATTQPRVRRVVRPIVSTAPVVRKARRVLSEEDERVTGGDPEVGASVSLTEAALAAQESLFVSDRAEHAPPLVSESFDKTTHSQMLERYLRELAAIEACQSLSESIEPVAVEYHITSPKAEASQPVSNANTVRPARAEGEVPLAKRQRRENGHAVPSNEVVHRLQCKSNTTVRPQKPQPLRVPLQAISNDRRGVDIRPAQASTNKVAPSVANGAQSAKVAQSAKDRAARTLAPKVTDFTFQVVGQQQLSFQERLAAWQAREAEAARAGKQTLQPLALPPKDPAKQARRADKASLSKRRSPVKAKEFQWHSDKRARERQDWEERLREKEQILAELAEIKRLEAEAAEQEAIRKIRAAQVPIAHPVPAFARSKRGA